MSRLPSHLTCPKCNYDLAGIIREDGSATCPECGSSSDSLRYSLPRNRWPTINKLIITHIVMMFFMNAICFLPLGEPGIWIWLFFQLVIMPSSVIIAERQLRKSNPPSKCTPTIPLLSLFVAFYTIMLLMMGYIVLSIIAYSRM